MSNSRNWTSSFNAINSELEKALKTNGVTKRRRPAMVARAASGRPSDLAKQARVNVSLRRIAGSAIPKQGRGV